MVNLNLTISLPLRVVCTQCQQDLKLEGQGPQPGTAVVKCPGCGVRIRLIQAPPPAGKPLRLPGQKWTPPTPKT